MRTRAGLIAIAAAVALGVAGCGGDDDESTTTAAEALTKEEFITQADQICADGDAAIEEAGAELGQGSSEEDVAAFVEETVIPNIQDQRDQIAALGIPEGDEGETEELIAELDSAIAEAEADPSVLLGSGDPFAEVNQMAQEYGLSACGDA